MRQVLVGSLRTAMLGALLCSTVSCSSEDPTEASAATVGSPGVDWDTFRASARLTPRGSLVVEGDMAFKDEEALYRFWQEERAPHAGQRLTVMTQVVNGISVDVLWPFPDNFNLTYCVGAGFTSTQMDQLLPALDSATQAWSQIVGVQHSRVYVGGSCDSTDTSVMFDVQRNTNGTFFGSAFFPNDPRSSRTLFIDDSAFTTNAGGRTLTGIITHELGHTLGFRHEHIWSGCPGERTDNARLVTDYDSQSIMHYPQCRSPQGGGYSISPLDYNGAVSLYGLAPALIQTVGTFE